MTTIIIKPLPHGSVPYHHIADMTMRDAFMKLNENVLSLSKQLAEAQKAVLELQRRETWETPSE